MNGKVDDNEAAKTALSNSEAGKKKLRYISLTSHPGVGNIGTPLPINWGSINPLERGPVICSGIQAVKRNAIGAHGGSYSIYRALALATKSLDPSHRPDYGRTEPAVKIGPHPSWGDNSKIATLDPFGAMVPVVFKDLMDKNGIDARPTIAVTNAHIEFPEVLESVRMGKLKPDGKILMSDGQVNIVKAAIEPVWYLPEVARRFGVTEPKLRELLFTECGGSYPELLTRSDMHVFLPPIGGMTCYIFGNVSAITDPEKVLAVRVHDECNGSDVFGSDICTCRPYLAHGIEVAIETAQQGGAGLVIYFRKEGRALGEVTKYLVYNARKRGKDGDAASEYFNCTRSVAGVEDTRFQTLMPDVLHWLGVTTIDKFVSMSNLKYDAIVSSGIKIIERIPIPKDKLPKDAQVEIAAKVYAGYDGGDVYKVSTKEELEKVKGLKVGDARLHDNKIKP